MAWGKLLPLDAAPGRQEGARYALTVLTLINLLNYADRYVLSSIKEVVKKDLDLTDAQTAIPMTGMICVYTVCAALFGYLADLQLADRRHILAAGVFLWSFATGLAGLARSFWQLVAFRSLIGVGEAAYATIVPAMISDFFPPEDRNAAFTILYMAIPIGGALGYAAGAACAAAVGWRAAFCVCGFPGLLTAVIILTINNPARGVNDKTQKTAEAAGEGRQANEEQGAGQDAEEEAPEGAEDQQQEDRSYWTILTNGYFMIGTAGMVANTFAIGGLADWMTAFIIRYHGVSTAEAGVAVGAMTVVGGFVGNLLGARTAEHSKNCVRSAYLLVPAIYMLPCAACAFIGLNLAADRFVGYAFVLATMIFFWTYQAPINTMCINVIPPSLRSRSIALQIFLLHALGDVISPPIIGKISDTTKSLRTGMQIVWVMILVAGGFWGCGALLLPPLPLQSSGTGDGPAPVTGVCDVLCSANLDHVNAESTERAPFLHHRRKEQ